MQHKNKIHQETENHYSIHFFKHAPKVRKKKESKSDFKHTENVFSECVKTALQCQSLTRGAVKYYIKAPALDTILNILNWSKCKGYRIALVWKSQIQLWRVWLPTVALTTAATSACNWSAQNIAQISDWKRPRWGRESVGEVRQKQTGARSRVSVGSEIEITLLRCSDAHF